MTTSRRFARVGPVIVLLLGLSGTIAVTDDLDRVAQERPDRPPLIQAARVMRGDAAATYLQEKIARNPQLKAAFEKSAKNLKARSFRPTGITTVLRRGFPVEAKPASLRRGAGITEGGQSYSERNGDGEVTFVSWDDGNNDTWEGEVYIEVYGLGAWRLTNDQIDIAAAMGELIWSDYVDGYAAYDTNNPPPPIEASYHRLQPKLRLLSYAVETRVMDGCGCPSSYYDRIWGQWGRCTNRENWGCHLSRCGGAAVACGRTGPAFVHCLAWTCGGASVSCAVQITWRYYGACGVIW